MDSNSSSVGQGHAPQGRRGPGHGAGAVLERHQPAADAARADRLQPVRARPHQERRRERGRSDGRRLPHLRRHPARAATTSASSPSRGRCTRIATCWPTRCGAWARPWPRWRPRPKSWPKRAARAVKVEYEPLPVITDPIEAMQPGAEPLYDTVLHGDNEIKIENNIACERTIEEGDVGPGLCRGRCRRRGHVQDAQDLPHADGAQDGRLPARSPTAASPSGRRRSPSTTCASCSARSSTSRSARSTCGGCRSAARSARASR